jgi:hypothetical protein
MTEGPVIRRSLLLLALLPALVGCASASSSPAGSTDSAPTATPSPTSARPSLSISPPPFKTAPPTAAPVVGEVPAAIIDQAKADLARRTGLDPATFSVVRAEEVVWSDGSLGCPVPGQAYIQVVTPGYWIGLEAGSKTYDYRATRSGLVRLCDQPNPKPPSG